MKKLIPALAVVTLLTMTAVAAPPENDNQQQSRRRGRPDYAALIAKLDLTAEQRQQIDELQRTSRAQMAAYLEGARATREAIRAARAEKNAEKAAQLQAEFDEQRAQMKLLQETEVEDMLKVLTTEQRAQLDKLKTERAERLKEHRENVRED